MAERKQVKKYHFTVEGESEQRYLAWLQRQINASPDALYQVLIKAVVEPNPFRYAKRINPLVTPAATHLCDYEADDDFHINRFRQVLSQLKEANSIKGRNFKYSLGYSNYTFELWMILHKLSCNAALADRTKYLPFINRAFGEKFESLTEYKKESNFERCLSKLSLDDVKQAITRAKYIMAENEKAMRRQEEYRGFHYYRDNPSLTVWEAVAAILIDCGLLEK